DRGHHGVEDVHRLRAGRVDVGGLPVEGVEDVVDLAVDGVAAGAHGEGVIAAADGDVHRRAGQVDDARGRAHDDVLVVIGGGDVDGRDGSGEHRGERHGVHAVAGRLEAALDRDHRGGSTAARRVAADDQAGAGAVRGGVGAEHLGDVQDSGVGHEAGEDD